jgi:hypothetical protein
MSDIFEVGQLLAIVVGVIAGIVQIKQFVEGRRPGQGTAPSPARAEDRFGSYRTSTQNLTATASTFLGGVIVGRLPRGSKIPRKEKPTSTQQHDHLDDSPSDVHDGATDFAGDDLSDVTVLAADDHVSDTVSGVTDAFEALSDL